MGDIVKIKRTPRPLKATFDGSLPYVVQRYDEDDGSIRYEVFDLRPETYRLVCSTNDECGTCPYAKLDAERIARGLNLLVQYGLES